jgi:hypothetical protein
LLPLFKPNSASVTGGDPLRPAQSNLPDPQSPVTQEKFPVVESVVQSVRPQKRPVHLAGTVIVEFSPGFKMNPVVGIVAFPLVVYEAGHTV